MILKSVRCFVIIIFTAAMVLGSGSSGTFKVAAANSGIVDGSVYKIVNKHSGKVLEIGGWSVKNGGNAQQWESTGGNNQKWNIESVSGGHYRIVNVNSGKSLEIGGWSVNNGGNAQQWQWTSGANQKWDIQAVGGGYFKIVNVNSGKALEVEDSSVSDGANVQQWSYGGGDNQKWSFVFSANININTSSQTTYNSNFRGYNNEPERTAVKYNDDDFINKVNNYGPVGFVRWPGGTPSNSFSWKLGMTDAEYTGQTQGEARRYYNQLYAIRYSQAKGYDRISNYRKFLWKTGAKAVIMVNAFQSSKKQVRDLARYLYQNHIPVLFFELGNEVSFYVSNSGNQQPEYKTGTDYLNRMKVFNDIIKDEYPGAKTIISMSNWQDANFDNDIFNYPNKYWDGVTFHRFRGNGNTFPSAMKSANQYLADWDSLINNYYVANLGNPKIFIGEHGVKLGGKLANTQYHGIYVSESILRLVTNPNISYMAGYRIMNGVFSIANKHTRDLEDAYQNGQTVDTTKFNFNPYSTAPALSLKVVDGAVNRSTTAWGTSVTGGAVVKKNDGTTMPALFAQAFKGNNGKRYEVITNKSAYSHDVTLKVDGAKVSSTMTLTYTTSSDPSAKNTDANPTDISVQTKTSDNPITVPPYSVMRVEWNGTFAPSVPEKPSLIYADADSGSVSLKWQSSQNADGYKLKYGTSPGDYTHTMDVGNVTSYNVDGLINNKTYYFAIKAYNSEGSSAVSNEAKVSLEVPSAPVIRKVYPERFGKIAVEWESVQGATGYKVKYGTSQGNYTHTIDAGNNVGQLVKDLTPGTTYHFVVTAYNGLGESVNSTEMSVTAKSWLPLAPHDAQITSENSTSISLSWKPSRATTYREYFEDGIANGWSDKQGTWSIVNNSTRGVTFYQSPLNGKAITIFSNSAKGNYEAETMAEKVATPSNKLAYSYGLVARYVDNENYYKFVYNVNEDRFKLVKVDNNNLTVLASKTVSQILAEKNAHHLNRARLDMYIRVKGNKITCSLNQFGPILQVTDSTFTKGGFGFITLNVKANYDWGRLYRDNATNYIVYRSQHPNTGFAQIANVTGTSFTDQNLQAGKAYYYRIKAKNSHGISYHYSNVLKKG